MKRERDRKNYCGKNIRYREEPTGEIYPIYSILSILSILSYVICLQGLKCLTLTS